MLPASAGMILIYGFKTVYPLSAPRIRGDDSSEEQTANVYRPCSPHPRG